MIKTLIAGVTKIGAEVGLKVVKHVKDTTKLSATGATKAAGKKLKEAFGKWKQSLSAANKDFANSVKTIVKESAVDVTLNEEKVFSLEEGNVKLNSKSIESYIFNLLQFTVETTIDTVLGKFNLGNSVTTPLTAEC